MAGAVAWQTDEALWLEVYGARLEARAWGKPPDEAPTLVLLHEGLGSVAQWKAFPEQLTAATGFGVFAYSRAGYGRSSRCTLPRPLDYMTREAMDVLPAVFEQIGFQRGALLGHSDGASIAAIYVGTAQDVRMRGLCMMAPHFFTESVGLEAIAQAKVAFELGDLRDRLAKYHVDPDVAFRGWNDAWLDTAFRNWNIEEVIGRCRVPALVIQGRDDPYGTMAQVEALQTAIYSPLDTLMLENCRHAPHVEQNAVTLDAIASFLARLDTTEASNVGAE